MKIAVVVIAAVALSFPCWSFSNPNTAGWGLLMENKPLEAKDAFLKNVKQPDKAIAAEALRGLTEVYHYLGDDDTAARYYFQSGIVEPQPAALCAGILNAYHFSRTAAGASIKEGYRLLSDIAEKAGVFKGEFKDLLAERFLNDGELRKANSIANSLGPIRQWMMIGPFDNISNSGYNTAYPPETRIDFSKMYPAKDGNLTRWSAIDNTAATGWIFLENHTDAVNAAFYFYCTVNTKEPRQAHLAFGASGSFKVFLNGTLVLADSVFRNTGIDMFQRPVMLNKGNNALLVKVCHEGGNRVIGEGKLSNFNLRLLDDAYEPLRNLTYNLSAPADSAPFSGQPCVSCAPSPLADSIIGPLKNRLSVHGDDIDAALLCMRAYNSMEKTDEGQMLARAFIQKYPRSSLWRQLYSESLVRSKKYTEGQTELKTAFVNSPLNFAAWSNELYTVAKSADPRRVMEFIESSPALCAGSLDGLLTSFAAHTETGKRAEAVSDLNRVEQQYSMQYPALSTLAALYMGQGQLKKAEKLIRRYLDRERANTVLYKTLANSAVKQGSPGKVEDIIAEELTYVPCNASAYYTLADMYYSSKNYKKARENINRCCAISPSNADALNLKGNILISLGDKDGAKQAFNDAITFTSDDFNAWENLRTLQNKPTLESLAPLPAVDSIIKTSLGWKLRDNENGAILTMIDDVFFYPSHCSRERTFMVVRLPTQNAIDAWKERTVGYNDYFQTVSIERAYSYSTSGSQTQADIQDNKIVFKTLQPGDFIVLEWSIKNFFMGEMAPHVYGEEDFQLPFPVFDGRLRLVTPKTDTIPYTIFGDSIRADISPHDDYRVAEFSRLPYKSTLDETFMAADWPGKRKVTYSTFQSWDQIVTWYDDLTRHKNDNTLELKALADSLFRGCATPEAKVANMHRYITGAIRYSYVPFRQSGWIPQPAHDVLATKIGDCKDMASLGKALLTCAGVPAYLVLVNTTSRQYIDHAYIGPDFNHCILCYAIGGKDRFLDLTDNSGSARSLPKGDQGAMALIIRTGTAAPTTLPFDRPEDRLKRRTMTVSVDKNGQLKEQGVTLRTGIYAANYRDVFRFESDEKKHSIMRQMLARTYPDLTLDTFAIDSALGTTSDSLGYCYAFTAKNAVTMSGTTAIVSLHIPDAIEPDDYPVEEQRHYPIDLGQTDYDISRQETSGEILFPRGWKPISLPQTVSLSSSYGAYSIRFSLKGNVITYRRQAAFNFNKQVPVIDYTQFRAFLNAVSKADAVQLVFFTH